MSRPFTESCIETNKGQTVNRIEIKNEILLVMS